MKISRITVNIVLESFQLPRYCSLDFPLVIRQIAESDEGFSSQMLVSNNESIISTYSSDTQYAMACDSYGEIPGRSPG